MGADCMDAWIVGVVCADVGDLLYSGVTGGDSMQVGDVGHVPKHWEEAGRVPPSVGMETDRADSAAEPGWDVGVLFPGGVDVGGSYEGGGDLCCPPSEQCHVFYHNKAHYLPVSWRGA